MRMLTLSEIQHKFLTFYNQKSNSTSLHWNLLTENVMRHHLKRQGDDLDPTWGRHVNDLWVVIEGRLKQEDRRSKRG